MTRRARLTRAARDAVRAFWLTIAAAAPIVAVVVWVLIA